MALLLFSIAKIIPNRINVVDEFPNTKKFSLVMRILCGQLTFAFVNVGVQTIPISLFRIIFNTSTFWTSILGLLVNGEPIVAVEVTGMVLCFGLVVFLGIR